MSLFLSKYVLQFQILNYLLNISLVIVNIFEVYQRISFFFVLFLEFQFVVYDIINIYNGVEYMELGCGQNRSKIN